MEQERAEYREGKYLDALEGDEDVHVFKVD